LLLMFAYLSRIKLPRDVSLCSMQLVGFVYIPCTNGEEDPLRLYSSKRNVA
jgi:hypothetical protein